MNISLFISGGLGFLALEKLYETHLIEFIATDSKSDEIIHFAKRNNISLFIGNPRNGKLRHFYKKPQSEILLSINYLFLIEDDVIGLFRYPINFHGSLLPKYRGRTPHIWAIINNEKRCGVTAHYINNGCDTGEIILQEIVEIGDEDTGNDVLKKYSNIYPSLIDKILLSIQNKSIKSYEQDNELATYYGKRVPEDGAVNWNWQRERIRNWVRALSYPYPGAFTFIDKVQIIIDKVEFSDVGYSNDIPNGTIIQSIPSLIIKTPNGAVKICEIRNSDGINLCLKYKILGNENR